MSTCCISELGKQSGGGIHSQAFVGSCPDMCPEKERLYREEVRRLSIYEIIPGSSTVCEFFFFWMLTSSLVLMFSVWIVCGGDTSITIEEKGFVCELILSVKFTTIYAQM